MHSDALGCGEREPLCHLLEPKEKKKILFTAFESMSLLHRQQIHYTYTQAVNSLESFRPSVYTICIIDNSPGSTSAGLPESSPGSFSVLSTEKAQRKLYFGSVYLYSYPFIKIIKQISAPSVNRQSYNNIITFIEIRNDITYNL